MKLEVLVMGIKIDTIVRTVRDLIGDARFKGIADPHGLLEFSKRKYETYRTNPYLSDVDQPCQLIGVCDGRVIGRRNSFPARIVANGHVIDCRISGSFYVDPSVRSSLYALTLINKAKDFPNGELNINCGLSEQNKKLFSLLGSSLFALKFFETGGRFSRWYRCGNFSGIKKLVADCLNGFVYLLNCVFDRRRWSGLPKWSVRRVSMRDQEFLQKAEKLVADDRHQYREDISKEWIRWVLEHDFSMPSDGKILLGVYDGDDVVGFALARCDLKTKTGKIFEWQVDRRYSKQEGFFICLVAKRLLHFMYRISIAVSEDGSDMTAIFKDRFVASGENWAVVTIDPYSKLNELPGIHNSTSWRVRPGMGDAPFW